MPSSPSIIREINATMFNLISQIGNHQKISLRRINLNPEVMVIVFILPLVMYLAFINLTGYPTISGWDEGMYLEFAHNLVYHGEYATLNDGVFERLAPVGGTGPTLIIPVGLALWLGNNSLAAARSVMGIYLLMAVASVYALVRQINGSLAAMCGVIFFLVAGYPNYGTLWIGRQVLAEIPALAFTLVGLLIWIESWQRGMGWLIVASVSLALAVVTKNQLIWIIWTSLSPYLYC